MNQMLPSTTATPSPTQKALSLILCLTALLLAFTGVVDQAAKRYTEDGFQRAIITFGIARGLNGVISVAQGTEVAIQPAGIGLNFTPGQILDPINDLVERFSWVMLASSTALGMQRVLLNVSQWTWFNGSVATLLILALLVHWLQRPQTPWVKRMFYKLAMAALVLRFAVPLSALASEGFYHVFLAPHYENSRSKLETATVSIGEVNKAEHAKIPPPADTSMIGSAKQLYQNMANSLNIDARIEAYKKAAAHIAEYAVDLIVVFLLQTVAVPLFCALGIWKLLKSVFAN